MGTQLSDLFQDLLSSIESMAKKTKLNRSNMETLTKIVTYEIVCGWNCTVICYLLDFLAFKNFQKVWL